MRINKATLDFFEEEIETYEFIKGNKLYSISFDYTNWGELVIYNETDKKLVKKIKQDIDFIDNLPNYVIEAIEEAVFEFYQ